VESQYVQFLLDVSGLLCSKLGRCDVYITSHSQGSLAERLEIVALLWQNEVSADLMYDSAVGSNEDEILAMAQREGML